MFRTSCTGDSKLTDSGVHEINQQISLYKRQMVKLTNLGDVGVHVRRERQQHRQTLTLWGGIVEFDTLKNIGVEEDPLENEILILIIRSEWKQWGRLRIHYEDSC